MIYSWRHLFTAPYRTGIRWYIGLLVVVVDFLYCLVCLREILVHKKNQNMEEIQGGHCPCSTIQGGQPITLPPPCRAPVLECVFYKNFSGRRVMTKVPCIFCAWCGVKPDTSTYVGPTIPLSCMSLCHAYYTVVRPSHCEVPTPREQVVFTWRHDVWHVEHLSVRLN